MSIREICEITLENLFFFDNIEQIINKVIRVKPSLEKTIYRYLGSLAFSYLKTLKEQERKYWKQEFNRDIKRIRNLQE